jgi:alkylation response protein AidB-like acyl-CoA dehydrogenase
MPILLFDKSHQAKQYQSFFVHVEHAEKHDRRGPLTLYTAARMFTKDPEHAMVAAHEAKWMAKEALQKVMWSAAEVCGSTSLFQNHPLERFYRDMHLHMMHGRHDMQPRWSARPSSAKLTTSIAHTSGCRVKSLCSFRVRAACSCVPGPV